MSELTAPLTRAGGSSSYRRGVLKKRLDSIQFAVLTPGFVTSGTETARLKLQGLEGTLNVQIAAGYQYADGTFIDPNVWFLPGGITMQLTPITKFGDGKVMAGRPVFQDPTLSVNNNNPLPMDLPFFWEFSTEADEVFIDLVCAKDQSAVVGPLGAGSNTPVTAICQVTVEYNGAWWDTEAIRYSLSEVKCLNVNNIIQMGLEGG